MPTLDEELAELEKRIRQLKIEYDIFLIGGKKTPPRNLQSSVDTMIQRLLEEKRFAFAQKFKFQTLVARYSSYRELWRKKNQEREEKGILRSEEELQSMIEHGLTRPLETTPPDKYVFVTDNPAAEPQQLQAMFDFLNEAHRRVGDNPPNMDFDKFRKLIETRTEEIRKKYKCRYVEFSVSVDSDENKVKFAAKLKK
ncbi:MAG TPA: MXAN_5187 C-terminal domain-containing protein [Acidobacteriota bacterium]|nr:MXAN_5187 C-terminal domain-containing protein [Acidobacteriota bacterium]